MPHRSLSYFKHTRRIHAIELCLKAEGLYRIAERDRSRPDIERAIELLEDAALEVAEIGLSTRTASLLAKARVLRAILLNSEAIDIAPAGSRR